MNNKNNENNTEQLRFNELVALIYEIITQPDSKNTILQKHNNSIARIVSDYCSYQLQTEEYKEKFKAAEKDVKFQLKPLITGIVIEDNKERRVLEPSMTESDYLEIRNKRLHSARNDIILSLIERILKEVLQDVKRIQDKKGQGEDVDFSTINTYYCNTTISDMSLDKIVGILRCNNQHENNIFIFCKKENGELQVLTAEELIDGFNKSPSKVFNTSDPAIISESEINILKRLKEEISDFQVIYGSQKLGTQITMSVSDYIDMYDKSHSKKGILKGLGKV